MERYVVFTTRDRETRCCQIGNVEVKAGDRLILVDIYTSVDKRTAFNTKRTISLVRLAIKVQNQKKTLYEILTRQMVNLDGLAGEIEYMTVFWRENFIPDTIDGKKDTLNRALDMEQCLLELAGQSPSDFNEDFISRQAPNESDEESGELNGPTNSGGFIDLGAEPVKGEDDGSKVSSCGTGA